jgi:hypothetical protein
MKKNLILLTALLSSAVSFAQQRAHTFAITPKVGVNVSSLKNLNGAVYYAVGNPYSGGTGISTSTGNDYFMVHLFLPRVRRMSASRQALKDNISLRISLVSPSGLSMPARDATMIRRA